MPSSPIADSDRYSRQILFPGIGPAGQQRLQSAHAAIIGVGATGAATASLLARAGVGRLTLIDRDIVEPSNLQRQMLFDEADAAAATPKAEAARAKIVQFNSAIRIDAHITDLVPANIHSLLGEAQLLLDCTDNFETRYLLNDYAVQQGKPWIYAGAVAAQAATMTILSRSAKKVRHSERSEEPLHFAPAGTTPGAPCLDFETWEEPLQPNSPGAPYLDSETWEEPLQPNSPGAPCLDSETWEEPSLAQPTACLACLFPTPPTGQTETCDTAGILGAAVNLAGSLQTCEALKILTGQPELLRRTFLSIDLWTNQRTEISASSPDPDCPVCGHRRFTHLAGTARPHITLCGRNSVQIHEHHRPLSLLDLQHRLLPNADITDLRANALLLRFRRGPHLVTVFPDGRALIQGTTDTAVARSLYARFIGA